MQPLLSKKLIESIFIILEPTRSHKIYLIIKQSALLLHKLMFPAIYFLHSREKLLLSFQLYSQQISSKELLQM